MKKRDNINIESIIKQHIESKTVIFSFFFLSFSFILLSLFPFLGNALIDIVKTPVTVLKGSELNVVSWQESLCESSFELAILFFLFGVLFCFFQADKRISKEQKTLICRVSFIIYLLLTLITLFFHEPWRDEIHSWFLAKNYSVSRLFYEMRYEGHFVLWYLILMPFAKTGFPIITLNIISWVITCFAMGVFLKYSNFYVSTKISVLFSSAFFYWYPIVSRCYSLVAPLIFILAIVYEKRNEKTLLFAVLLALLSNTHAYLEGFVGIITLLFLIQDMVLPWKNYTTTEKKQHIIALCIIVSGILIAIMQVVPAFFVQDKSEAVSFHLNLKALNTFLSGSNMFKLFKPLFCFFILTVFAYLFKKDKYSFLIMVCSYLYMYLFAVCLYDAAIPNRALLWFIILIFSLWISKISVPQKSILILICTLFVFRPSLNYNDLKEDYSSLQTTKSYIEKTYRSDTDIFINTGHNTATLALMLSDNYSVHHIESLKQVELFSFSGKYNPHIQKIFSEYINDVIASGRFSTPFVLVSDCTFSNDDLQGISYKVKEFPCIQGGTLWLYEIMNN